MTEGWLKPENFLHHNREKIIEWPSISIDTLEWPSISIDTSSLCKLYYKPFKKQDGFIFYCTEAIAWEIDDITNIQYIKVLFHGRAYYDGVRHLYIGHTLSENEGYLYCPNIEYITQFFTQLQKLEKKYCKEVD